MIRKYTFGRPMKTDAVEKQISPDYGQILFFNVIDAPLSFEYNMEEDDIIYGLGENVRGMNKRGWIYESKCSDDPNHREDKHSLYAAHNFLLVNGKDLFGVFIDYPGVVRFDIGYTKLNKMVICPESAHLDIYIITADNLPEIVKEFRKLIGKSYIPPKWAFGYGQSRWSYMSENEVKELVKWHRDHDIPLDSVYLDIDYMERYKDFTINEETFPRFEQFVEQMKEQKIHLVPIIDAGVKIEDGYEIYEEGKANDYFCKNEDGSDFVAGVWPGRVHFPDMLNKDARKWFGCKYKFLLDKGIDGFWNDMNEPAIFYSEEHLQEVFDEIEEYKDKNLDIRSFFDFKNLVAGIDNNLADYKRFYHNIDGEKIRHDKVHNLYGYNMTRAAGEAFEELSPDRRILIFSRSSYIGMHRYGGIWTGDNLSWWSHILLNMKMMSALNMCGILFTGADLGGFGADTTEDLMLRWLEFGVFTPLMRNHSASGTRRQEISEFENTNAFRNIIGIRYGLLPYLYSEYMKAALRDEMLFKPLSFEYMEDSFAARVEDQLLVGDSIMIAPVYEQNAKGRYVYLPEKMKLVKMKSLSDRKASILEQGHHYIDIDLDELILFIRPNKILPLSRGGNSVEEVDFKDLELIVFGEKASYELYDDDGYGKDYANSGHFTVINLKGRRKR